MSIRCKHCDSRIPEWDEIEGCCRECYEDLGRINAASFLISLLRSFVH
jgi:hypothetical protein